MSVKWTKEQQSVVDLRDRSILVSAAAGSGKTAVLVERIITMLTRQEDPLSVDELLIVTFTEAAAAEMKERIRRAIEKKAQEDPFNEHLRQQATLIHSASITTIHSFCLSVIRENFHVIDLDPSFRIGEEGELKLLERDVLQELLEEKYGEGQERFLAFAESYASGKSDRRLEEIILKLYEFSRSCPDPEGWLADCVRACQVQTGEELEKTPFFAFVREEVDHAMETAVRLKDQALALCLGPDGPYMYEEMLESDMKNVERFRQAATYARYRQASEQIAWKKLAPNRDKAVSKDKADRVKKLRKELKDEFDFLARQYFSQTEEELLAGLAVCAPMMAELKDLTEAFAARFEEKKRSRGMIDYSDMEQYALRILTEKTEEGLRPSPCARVYQEQFREVMIDEYQDSNLIQEAILTSVSRTWQGRNNIFMVGDVKQSIYRFRLSRPELFMEKFDTYRIYEGEDTDSRTQRIDLFKNFRSRPEVLESVNALFRRIMIPELGGITYDDRAALWPGASYPESRGNDTELLLVDGSLDEELEEAAGEKLSARKLEARAVADCIRRILKEQLVTDKETGELRPTRYGDIVILTRSIKGWSDVFMEVLLEEGIPACAGTKEGYFETREIGVLLDYFRVLQNEKQDIPLTAVLSSWFGQLTDEELARIRIACPDRRFCEAVQQYRSQGEDPALREKLAACLDKMDYFREKASYTAIHELLWEILDDTGYGDYVAALPGGEQRRANVDMLAQKAMAFESTSYQGLFNFIRYIEQLQKYNVDYGEASVSDENADTVRIMSIHKSKGLEFPVVIAAGMGKGFNTQDTKGNILIHASLGVGMDVVDLKYRTKAPSFYKQVIQRREKLENLGEEMRVLYVALTRAKEKLILVGTMKDPAGRLEELRALTSAEEELEALRPLSFGELSRASSYLDWILPAVAAADGKAHMQVEILTLEGLVRRQVQEEAEGIFTKKALEDWDTEKVYDGEMKESLEEQFSYRYPHPDLEGRKLKFTVSELKKREYLRELSLEEPGDAGEMPFEEPEVVPLIPRFRAGEEELTGASRGSAYHRVMELLDFTEEYTQESLSQAVRSMEESGRIAPEMARCVRPGDILEFTRCESGGRMREAARRGQLFREQPFVIGVDMAEVYPDSAGKEEDKILVQGIIDAWFQEEDGIVVLDYKTDQVKTADQLVEKYHAQLDYYAKALEQLLGRPVREKIIYSFTLQEEIILPG